MTTQLLLAAADDKLVLGHHDSDWTGLAPMLEEDIAFSSFAQDDIAHAQAIYEHIASITGGNADDIALGRTPEEYRCAAITELPDEFNWGFALVRLMFCNTFNKLRFDRLAQSNDAKLAALAKRLSAEQFVAIEHVEGWIERLGNGTDEARDRLQTAIDQLQDEAIMLFEPVEGQHELVASGFYPGDDGSMFEQWRERLQGLAERSQLALSLDPPDTQRIGGRRGAHTPHLTALLDEMCEVYRIEPGASW